jgi:hypothetical protein
VCSITNHTFLCPVFLPCHLVCLVPRKSKTRKTRRDSRQGGFYPQNTRFIGYSVTNYTSLSCLVFLPCHLVCLVTLSVFSSSQVLSSRQCKKPTLVREGGWGISKYLKSTPKTFKTSSYSIKNRCKLNYLSLFIRLIFKS